MIYLFIAALAIAPLAIMLWADARRAPPRPPSLACGEK